MNDKERADMLLYDALSTTYTNRATSSAALAIALYLKLLVEKRI